MSTHLMQSFQPRKRVALAAALTISASAVLLAAAPAQQARADAPAHTWTIQAYRHYASDTQEKVGHDEVYLATIRFRFRLGVPGSTHVDYQLDQHEIDNIDKHEYHTVPDAMGKTTFTDVQDQWDPVAGLLTNQGPEIIGTVTQVMESDTAPWSSVRQVLASAVGPIQQDLASQVENPTFDTQVLVAGGLALGTLVDPAVATRLKDTAVLVAKGAAVDVAAGELKGHLLNKLQALRDDPIGRPVANVFVAGDGFTTALAESALAPLNQPRADKFGGLVTRDPADGTGWDEQFKGDGADYSLFFKAFAGS